MKREARIILIIGIALMVPALTFAADKGIFRLQGVVMAVDVKKDVVTVNERTFLCGQRTSIYNERGALTSLDKLRVRGWVYIEAIPGRGNQANIAERIYVIPKYIDEKEKHLYPFIQ